MFKFLLLFLLFFLSFFPGETQNLPNREFRGVWLATVGNLDWPVAGASAASQQLHLRNLLDKIKEANFNAVFFQVRTESDAFYVSAHAPWSRFLTGTQGVDPGYDPLAFAVEEAHKRGLELHAWFNPFRGNYSASAAIAYANNHISKTRPEWLLNFSTNKRILNPGIPAVREYIATVVSEVAENYAIDGVHFDDYFYPYPEGSFTGISNEDAQTFAQYGSAFSNIKDWRRNNVNETIRAVNNRLQAVNPKLRFGVSPFGIWKNGVPAGITGMDAYNVIYADAVTWLEQGYLDYVTPQLYWAMGGAQDYRKLLPWWADKAQAAGRHLYPGHILNKAGYTPEEVPNQIALNRENQSKNVYGSVLFRANDIQNNTNQAFTLLKDLIFRLPAAPPAMAWKSGPPPAAPTGLTIVQNNTTGHYDISWQRSPGNTHAFKRYLVYSLPTAPAALANIPNGTIRAFTTAETYTLPAARLPDQTSYWVVTELSQTNQESEISNVVAVTNGVTGAPDEAEVIPVVVFPNPTDADINIRFALEKPAEVQVSLFSSDGKNLLELESRAYTVGAHTLQLPATGLSAGVYLLVLTVNKAVVVKKVVVE